MKKVLVEVAFMMCLGTVFCVESSAVENTTSVVQVQNNDYKDIKLEALNAQVQAAIKGYESTYTVKSLGYDEATKQTQVTLTAKDGSDEKVVILDDAGKEI